MLLFSRSQVEARKSRKFPLLQYFTFFCIQVESSICLLRGQIYEAMENWVLAAENYREALRRDVHCFEAFELLMKHQMLTAEEGL